MKATEKKPMRADGFTLIEVLVAVTILAMIFSILFGTFFYTVKNAEEQEERAAIYHKANFILNNINQNVSSAYIPFGGQYKSDEDEEKPVFSGTDAANGDTPGDALSIFTTNPRFAAPSLAGEIAYVSYETTEEATEEAPVLHDENNPLTLRCTVTPLLTGAEEEGAAPQWAINIHSLDFQFFDGEDWVSKWDFKEQESLPSALKAVLEIADSGGTIYSFSTIAQIHANAVLEETKTTAEEMKEKQEAAQEEAKKNQGREEALDEEQDTQNDQGNSAANPFIIPPTGGGEPGTLDELFRNIR
jgi:general secretion pathway protein J